MKIGLIGAVVVVGTVALLAALVTLPVINAVGRAQR